MDIYTLFALLCPLGSHLYPILDVRSFSSMVLVAL